MLAVAGSLGVVAMFGGSTSRSFACAFPNFGAAPHPHRWEGLPPLVAWKGVPNGVWRERRGWRGVPPRRGRRASVRQRLHSHTRSAGSPGLRVAIMQEPFGVERCEAVSPPRCEVCDQYLLRCSRKLCICCAGHSWNGMKSMNSR